jgi:hypothetical protein
MVTVRRQIADALGEDYKRGHTENMRDQLVNLQNTIEAIDRALADEDQLEKATPGMRLRIK